MASVCQAASMRIQYFLKNYALGLINKSAGAAFDQEMGLDRWGSQPVFLAYHCLSTKFKHQSLPSIKCFLIKWNRRAESTVPLIFWQILGYQHTAPSPCAIWLLNARPGMQAQIHTAQASCHLQYCAPSLARCFWEYRGRSWRAWAMEHRGGISAVFPASDTTVKHFRLVIHLTSCFFTTCT